MRDWTLTEFFFDEVVVVKIIVGKIESLSFGRIGPTSFFIRAAFWTCFGIARDACTAVGAGFGGHFTKLQAPRSKLQRSSKHQISNTKKTQNPNAAKLRFVEFWDFVGIWSFSGAWDLEFGASPSFHPRIFFVGLEVEAHEHVIMGDGLHVFDVIFQAQEFAEAE